MCGRRTRGMTSKQYAKTERHRISQRKYYLANRERETAKHRERYYANRERLNIGKRKYYQANRERLLAKSHEYGRTHLEQGRETQRRRRATQNGCARERFKATDIFERDKWRCRLCRCKTPRDLQGTMEPNAPVLDHVIPLKLGGPHTKANTQCLCRHCNSAKSAKYQGQLAFA